MNDKEYNLEHKAKDMRVRIIWWRVKGKAGSKGCHGGDSPSPSGWRPCPGARTAGPAAVRTSED